jgi:hypothetical protein
MSLKRHSQASSSVMNIIGKVKYSPENTTKKRLKSTMTGPSDDFRPSYRVITQSGSEAAKDALLERIAAISQ